MKLIIILVLSSFTLMANSQNNRFDSKVKYEYNVYLEVLNLKLGEASLSVKAPGNIDGINVYHLNFNVRTTKLGDTIYKIRNKIDVWVNQESLNVVKQNKNKDYQVKKNIKSVEGIDICSLLNKCNIDEISNYLLKIGKKKSFPDITTRQ